MSKNKIAIEEEYMSGESRENEVGERPRKKNAIGKKLLISGLIAMAFIGVIAGAAMWYQSHTSTPEYLKEKADKEVSSVVEKVSKLMLLPEGTPTVFIISDPGMLVAQQAFFQGAEKGDQLLVYSEVSKAIIYSEKRDMIVNVGPVTFDGTPAGTTAEESTSPATNTQEVVVPPVVEETSVTQEGETIDTEEVPPVSN
jgi:hypothetical protein